MKSLLSPRSVRLYAFAAALGVAAVAPAQEFSSGSTGADGALNVTENTTLPVPPDGVFNFTTVNVDEGVTLDFDISTFNLPIIMLAQGDVTIEGTIDLRGENGLLTTDPLAGVPGSEAVPGPGGGYGGIGGLSPANTGDAETAIGTSGGGPGGGAAANNSSSDSGAGRGGNGGSHFFSGARGTGNPNPEAPTYGDFRLITLSGGSGGAGGNLNTSNTTNRGGPGGGAGGGAILIASSTSIIVNGTIDARGGNGQGGAGFDGGGTRGSGGGAAGAIRLMANQIGGDGTLDVRGGTGVAPGGRGIVRIEAYDHGDGSLLAGNQTATATIPGIISIPPSQHPTVRIVSIGGQPVPEPPKGMPIPADVLVPGTEDNPVEIEIEAVNIPDGAIVTLRIPVANGDTLVITAPPLDGGTTTATADLPRGFGSIHATVSLPD